MQYSILVADDDNEHRDFLTEILQRRSDLTVTVARDGMEALYLLLDTEHHFDVFVTDYRMPGLTGLDVVRRARSRGRLGKVQTILCTGMTNRETVATAAREGIRHFLAKPYKPETLQAKLEEVLGKIQADRLRDEAAAQSAASPLPSAQAAG